LHGAILAKVNKSIQEAFLSRGDVYDLLNELDLVPDSAQVVDVYRALDTEVIG